MLIYPYSCTLRLSRTPVVSIGTTVLCIVVFILQVDPGFTRAMMYYPETWNPIGMITSSLAHADFFHITGNLIFFLAFAPAVEVLIDNKARFIWIMVYIAFVVGICDSIATLIGFIEPLPSLGLSGVVMGVIGLSAYLMPKARIKVFIWYGFGWKRLHIKAWYLALYYIGFDTFTMLTADDFNGIGVVAHVAGGYAGYLYGYCKLKDRRNEFDAELSQEIETMRLKDKYGKLRSEAYTYARQMGAIEEARQVKRLDDQYMQKLYQYISTKNDSRAICLLVEKYNLHTPIDELEGMFLKLGEWGPSRTQLCVGRLIIQIFDDKKLYSQAILYIGKCQAVSSGFILPVDSRTVFYSKKAIAMGECAIAQQLLCTAK